MFLSQKGCLTTFICSHSVQHDSLQQYKFIRFCLSHTARGETGCDSPSLDRDVSLNSPAPLHPHIRSTHLEVLTVPYSQRMHIVYKVFFQFVFLKDKLRRNDSKCLHMYFKPSMKNTPFQKKKNRYKSGFSVCFFLKKMGPTLHPQHPAVKSKCVTAQYFFNSFIL